MIRKTVIISIFIFFGLAAMAQPAMALSCARMMACMPTHSEDHFPGADDNHTCTCAQSTQQSINRLCTPLKRNLSTLDISSEYHFFQGLPLRYDEPLISQGTPYESSRANMGIDPSPHCPIFILNQRIIC